MSSSFGKKELKLQETLDLILSKDIRIRETGDFSGAALDTEGRGRINQQGKN